MKSNPPPYHLKTNKAIDRFLLLELLKNISDYSQYEYIGFGGPYLEDFKLFQHYYPDISLTSVEKDEDIYKRQCFHRISSKIKLIQKDIDYFFEKIYSAKKKAIVWLDYTDLSESNFTNFQEALQKIPVGSIVKFTTKAELPDTTLYDFRDNLLDSLRQSSKENNWSPVILPQIEQLIQDSLDTSVAERKLRTALNGLIDPKTNFENIDKEEFLKILLKAINTAAQKALQDYVHKQFQILHVCYYSDMTLMLSVTGICLDPEHRVEEMAPFQNYKFLFNESSQEIQKIDVPILSLKERLLLESYLPCKFKNPEDIGHYLASILSYPLGRSPSRNKKQLALYNDLYNYYPVFSKIFT